MAYPVDLSRRGQATRTVRNRDILRLGADLIRAEPGGFLPRLPAGDNSGQLGQAELLLHSLVKRDLVRLCHDQYLMDAGRFLVCLQCADNHRHTVQLQELLGRVAPHPGRCTSRADDSRGKVMRRGLSSHCAEHIGKARCERNFILRSGFFLFLSAHEPLLPPFMLTGYFPLPSARPVRPAWRHAPRAARPQSQWR